VRAGAPRIARRPSPRRAAIDLEGYAFLAPALAVVVAFTGLPIVFSLGLSFFSWDMMRPAPRFLGWDNYARLAGDPAFRNALANTLLYAVGTVLPSVALALLLALFLNRRLRGRAWFRSAVFAPVVTSTVALSLVWSWIYHPQTGLLNAGLEAVGRSPVRWLADPDTALWAIVGMSVWKSVGYNMVLFLAGLQQLPREVAEAARVDGAAGWRLHRDVTLPLLRPTLFFVVVVATIDAMQVFTQVDVMTGGGPARSTEMVVSYLVHRAFRTYEMGYASAIAWALFVAIVGLTALQSRFLARERG
jgi:ABC-type sugar transport system permease subunit